MLTLQLTFSNSLIIYQVKTKKIIIRCPVLISIDFDDFTSRLLFSFCFDLEDYRTLDTMFHWLDLEKLRVVFLTLFLSV